MPWLAGLAGAIGSGATTAGAGLLAAAKAAPGLLATAGNMARQAAQGAIPSFEAAKLATLGQKIPAGISLVGPGNAPSAAETALMFGSRGVPAAFSPGLGGKAAGLLETLSNKSSELQPLMELLSQNQRKGEEETSRIESRPETQSLELPTYQPMNFGTVMDDPIGFLRAFRTAF